MGALHLSLWFLVVGLCDSGEVMYGKPPEGAQYYDIYTDLYEQTQQPVPEGLREDIEGEDVVVTTTYGQLLGKRRTETILTGGAVTEAEWFLGIPYASPPVDQLRFKGAVRPEPWKSVRRATRFGPVCPQPDSFSYTQVEFQSEDCLYLNVYVPYQAESKNATYPVMVYFHGGSYFIGGSTIYTGSLLAQYGVIVVTVNYRLGLIGFYSANDPLLPGNQGLLDQIQALRWVKENIASFRGDPDRVTIFGNSAGGASVGLLTLSPLARGLFHRAIAQSGSPTTFWAAHNDTMDLRTHARAVAKVFNCDNDNMADMIACMRTVRWQDFLSAQDRLPAVSPSGMDFKPCVDGYVIPQLPRKLMLGGVSNQVTFMTGTVKDEWTGNLGWFIEELLAEKNHLDNEYSDGINRDTFEHAIEHVVTRRFKWDKSISDVIKNEYTDWSKVRDPIENRNQYVHFFTDMSMLSPTVEVATLLHRNNLPVYLYTFNHHSVFTDPLWWGSHHQIELNFIFGSPFSGMNVDQATLQNYTDDDRRVSQMMMKLWTNFAKTGNPTPEPLPGGVTWKQFLPETSDYMFIHSNNTRMSKHLRPDKVAFWTELVPTLIQRYQCVTSEESYRPQMWVFVAISICLLFLLLISLVVIVRSHKSAENHSAPRPVRV